MTVAAISRSFLVLLLTLATPLAAQSVKLKAHEIEALLGGNTAVGKWQGAPYRQFFGPDGATIYAQEGARSTLGEWRVDPERDEYQSLWPRDSEWEGWFVMEYAGDYFWVSKNTPPTPFKVLEGQQLVSKATQEAGQCALITNWAGGKDLDISALITADGPAQCGSSLAISGAKSVHCAWPFAYRAAAALDGFDQLVEQVEGCLGGSGDGIGDQSVNHPDSYDLREFKIEGGSVAVSLKDKGALQQTYIFLRAEHQPE